MIPTVRVQREDVDPGAIVAALESLRPAPGAVLCFVGLCRDEGGRLSGLELEHYPGMAEEEIARVAAMASERWPLLGVTAIHRHGLVRPGERIVAVATASAHRKAAFEAGAFLMDFLKTRAPFWKREHLADGSHGPWIEAAAADDAAAASWA